MAEQKEFEYTPNGIHAHPTYSYINTVTIQQYTRNIIQGYNSLKIKQEKLFENLFPAGATEHLGRATQRRNVLSHAEISIYRFVQAFIEGK
jgi:hypothetical protein